MTVRRIRAGRGIYELIGGRLLSWSCRDGGVEVSGTESDGDGAVVKLNMRFSESEAAITGSESVAAVVV